MAKKKSYTPKRLRRPEWDSKNAKYANLSNPEWIQGRVPKGFWDDTHNHVRYMKWLGKRLRIKKIDDWHKVQAATYGTNNGQSVLKFFGYSRIELLKSIWPGHEWLEWKFHSVPKGFWNKRSNRVRYLKWLGEQLGYESTTDWYRIRITDFQKNYGGALLAFFEWSPMAIVMDAFPKIKWKEWKFHQVPAGFWKNDINCRRYVDWLAKKLKIKKLDDWYKITVDDLKNNHGSTLLADYGKKCHQVRSGHIPRSQLADLAIHTCSGRILEAASQSGRLHGLAVKTAAIQTPRRLVSDNW